MAVFETHKRLFEATGGWERGETQMRLFAEPEVRKRTVQLIREAKKHDEQAFSLLKQLIDLL